MKTIIRNLLLSATLSASLNMHAAFVLFPDGDFEAGQGTWGEAGPAIFSYPSSDGNPGGYGAMNANGGWGVLVSSNNDGSFIPLASLGLVAGNGYNFQMDMRIEPGSNTNNLGELKLEWAGGGDTGDMSATYIDGNWNTHIFPVLIPSAATGLKVVPVCNDNNHVGFDNIGFDSVPYYVAPPPPTDETFSEAFDDVGTEAKWTLPSPPGTITSGLQWINTDGNPPGSTSISAENPDGVGANLAFIYTATGVDFGTGPVKVSFDAKLPTLLAGTAIHVRINGNFFGAIQGSFNGTTFTTYTQSFDLPQGFEGTDTFTLQFEFAMGAVPGSGATMIVDNLQILTNLAVSGPTIARIGLGTLFSWTPTVAENYYQLQASFNAGSSWSDIGPAYLGTDVSSVFDSDPAPFGIYRVVESLPATEEVVYNHDFTTELSGGPEGWQLGGNQPPTLITTDAKSPTNSVQILATSTVVDPEIPTYAAGVSVLEQNTTNATVDFGLGVPVVTPGKTYEFSFWFKQISSGPGYVQQYKVEFIDDVGAILLDSGVLTFSGTIGVWQQVTLSGLTAPAGTAAAKILIQGVTGAFEGSAGEMIIDDVSLTTPAQGGVFVHDLPVTVSPAAEISWQTKSGVSYQPESSSTLSGWLDFGEPVTGDGNVKAIYDDSPLVGSKFYRISF